MTTGLPTTTITIAISKLRRDGGTQSRARLNLEKVREYAAAMQQGDQFPPAIAYYDGTDYWVADGFHRLAAAEMNGTVEFPIEVRQGVSRDAVLYSFGANHRHGLLTSTDERRQSVENMLRDQEWRKWSNRRIGTHVNLDPKTIGEIRKRLEAAGILPQDTSGQRTIMRGDQTYTLATASIAASNASRSQSRSELPDRVTAGEIHPLMEPLVTEDISSVAETSSSPTSPSIRAAEEEPDTGLVEIASNQRLPVTQGTGQRTMLDEEASAVQTNLEQHRSEASLSLDPSDSFGPRIPNLDAVKVRVAKYRIIQALARQLEAELHEDDLQIIEYAEDRVCPSAQMFGKSASLLAAASLLTTRAIVHVEGE